MTSPVFLVGFMGSGKTQTGQLLAKRLGWSWLDLDEKIVEVAGKSIPEIFAQEGEGAFRKMERACLQEALASEATVVSCGGGIVTQPDNLRDLLHQSRVVCLRIQPETVFRRVGNDPRRPLLQGSDSMGQIRKLMTEREVYYQQFPLQIDVDKCRASEVVDRIIDQLRLLS
ncbi:shikimate kinase [Kiritimatiellaeota bacterium B1221]|nr:shikimate kinase [Kiritimatiellaeota bacterium B1221]